MDSNPWAYIGIIILIATAGIILLSFLITLLMSGTSKRVVNKNVELFLQEIESKLPGKNCGECGCSNCRAYAEAVLNRDLACDKCPYGEEGLQEALEACADRFWKIAEDRAPVEKKRFWKKRNDS